MTLGLFRDPSLNRSNAGDQAMTSRLASSYQTGADFAAQRDAHDPLANFRREFYRPPDRIYLDGNSLGLLSRPAEASILEALDAWRTRGIDGWLEGERPWFWIGEQLGALQAPLVGALPDEVVVTGALTINLHALLASFYRPTGTRTRILADALDFPSDIYAIQSWLRLRGLDPAQDLILVPSRDGRTIDENDAIAAMTDDLALVWLPSVLYRSGQLLDVERLTSAAHARGISIGFDLAHSAGSVPHRLHDWGVDFAVWCTYKYLNAGPGAVGSLFVHRRHWDRPPGLAGWWGSDKDRQFQMALEFTPASGAGAWQISTPAVLSAAALFGSLAQIDRAGLDAIRRKSLDLTAYLMYLADEMLTPLGFTVGTPREPARRGGHVALEHAQACSIAAALHAAGVVPDFREPNVIRLAPIPLYTTYSEVWQTVQILRDLVQSGSQLRPEPTPTQVS
jgi:kynureninase